MYKRNKKGQFVKGNFSWAKNHKHTKEALEKMGKTWFEKGHIMSQDVRGKISNTLKGKRPKNWSAAIKRAAEVNKTLKGEKSHLWQGGITPKNTAIRNSFKYKEIMKKMKERDNYTCQICGEHGGRLHTDHYPISFATIIKTYNIKSLEDALNCEAMWDERNLRTLCVNCHKNTDTFLIKNRWQMETAWS